jgi:cysteine desulfurase
MYGNNEIGTLQPIEEIGMLARKHNIPFHTDAVQAVGQVPISVKYLPVDMLSSSAHKFHGPKGVGFLYVKEGVKLPSFIHGGGQESGHRAGTENVAGIVGMAKALSIATKEMDRKS